MLRSRSTRRRWPPPKEDRELRQRQHLDARHDGADGKLNLELSWVHHLRPMSARPLLPRSVPSLFRSVLRFFDSMSDDVYVDEREFVQTVAEYASEVPLAGSACGHLKPDSVNSAPLTWEPAPQGPAHRSGRLNRCVGRVSSGGLW